jgi:hypothetical protein
MANMRDFGKYKSISKPRPSLIEKSLQIS